MGPEIRRKIAALLPGSSSVPVQYAARFMPMISSLHPLANPFMEHEQLFPIAAVEASTVVAKVTPRDGEACYGLPVAACNAAGERFHGARPLDFARRIGDRAAASAYVDATDRRLARIALRSARIRILIALPAP